MSPTNVVSIYLYLSRRRRDAQTNQQDTRTTFINNDYEDDEDVVAQETDIGEDAWAEEESDDLWPEEEDIASVEEHSKKEPEDAIASDEEHSEEDPEDVMQNWEE